MMLAQMSSTVAQEGRLAAASIRRPAGCVASLPSVTCGWRVLLKLPGGGHPHRVMGLSEAGGRSLP